MVTSALLRNRPDLRPSTSVANTSPGDGKMNAGTLPLAVLTYQLTNKIAASTRGGTTSIARCVPMGVTRERRAPGELTLLSPGDAFCNSNVSFSVVVVTLIDFPRSKLY